MKPSSLPRAGAFALALAFALTGCGLFTVEDGVAAKAVKVDLVFGAKLPSEQPGFTDPGNPFPDELPPLPPLPVLPPQPPDATEDLCPPTSAPGARDETVASIQRSHEPQGNEYLTAVKSHIEDQRPVARVDKRIIYDVELQESALSGDPERAGFQYFVRDTFSGIQMAFVVYPGQDDEQVQEGGLYLKRLIIPTKDREEDLHFIMQAFPHIKILDFPIIEGTELTSEAGDVAAKRTKITNPVTGDTVADVPQGGVVPSPNSITATSVVGDIDNKVQVCADLGAAYKVALDIKITGDFNQRIIGTFWLSPQYGGWPIKDDYFMFGDLLEGVFSNNIMRLPPAQCEDGLDNDGDGRVDASGAVPDPQCSSPKDNDESI